MEFIRQVLSGSQKVWLVHTWARDDLIKDGFGPGGTMAWALRELQPHQQAERQGVQHTHNENRKTLTKHRKKRLERPPQELQGSPRHF